MRLALISCEIFYREMCTVVARSVHQIDVTFLPKGLHDIGQAEMLPRLQKAVDEVEPGRYEAVLLGYGLCNNAVVGLQANNTPIVIPRAHDCITLFFGSRQRYREYFDAHPGTYFETSGWLERGEDRGELSQISIQKQIGMDMSYEELVAKYGEDNARYLYDTLCDPTRNYSHLTFIEMGIEPDARFEKQAAAKAAEHGFTYEITTGDMVLFERLASGDWGEEDFLVVRPGQRVRVTHDDRIIATAESGNA
jgi:hypothetical protein